MNQFITDNFSTKPNASNQKHAAPKKQPAAFIIQED
jgi:hypothetical protein